MALPMECATLRDYCSSLFAKVGVPVADARTVAESLVEADLRGIGPHGVSRVGIYLERLQGGVVNPRPTIRSLREGRGAALLDGDNGLGAVVGRHAMAEAVRRAESCGTAWVCVRNSNHFGTASWYTMQALQARCIGIALTSAPPTMPIWGGRSPFFGANPFAVAVPAGEEQPIVVDMATSVTARGEIILAAKKGELIPEGLAIDPAGRLTTDANVALAGAVLPCWRGPAWLRMSATSTIIRPESKTPGTGLGRSASRRSPPLRSSPHAWINLSATRGNPLAPTAPTASTCQEKSSSTTPPEMPHGAFCCRMSRWRTSGCGERGWA